VPFVHVANQSYPTRAVVPRNRLVGLAVTYGINFVLAILAVFKAGERGQPGFLWFSKTFSVGGLAFDQLTQLPTLDEQRKSVR
jgi:hypothetical protein